MVQVSSEDGGGAETGERDDGHGTYSSGLFCVSITAATGIPKLETGPQKSSSRTSAPEIQCEVKKPECPARGQQLRRQL